MTLQTAEAHNIPSTMSSLMGCSYQQGSEVRLWPSAGSLPKAPANDRAKAEAGAIDPSKKSRALYYATRFAIAGVFLTVTAAALPVWMIYSFIWLSKL